MADPRWLNEVEQTAWRGWIDASRRVEAALDRQLREDHRLTSDDYEVLVRLSEVDDRRLRMGELGEAVANSPSRVSQRVDRLVGRGFVVREPCPEDRRVSYAHLTEAGFAALEAAAPSHVAEVRRQFMDRLTAAQIASLAEILPILADGCPPDPEPLR